MHPIGKHSQNQQKNRIMSQKKKALTLTIPEPCGENFDAMTPVKGGKFCGACDKTIVDFRTMSEGQILNFYKKNNGKICGVFNEVQLNKAMPFPMKARPNRNWKAVAALAAGLMFSGGMIGQTTIPNNGKLVVVEQSIGKGEGVNTETSNPVKILKGSVLDGEEGLIGANIIIEGTTIGTTTDIDGFFELPIPNDLKEIEVTVSYVGFESQTLLFNDKYPIPSNRIDISLGFTHPEMGMIMGIMIMEEAPVCETEVVPVQEIIPKIKADVSSPKGIPTDKQMTIFPNPFMEDFRVSYDFEQQGDYLFHLYDNNGRLLFAKMYNLLKGKQTVDLNMTTQHLENGLYILQISDKQDRILATKKVFKGQA